MLRHYAFQTDLPLLLMCFLWLSGTFKDPPILLPSPKGSAGHGGRQTEGRRRAARVGQDGSLFEFGHDADEEDHADEDEADHDEHGPEQPVDRLLRVLLQPLRFRLQLLQVLVSHLEGV